MSTPVHPLALGPAAASTLREDDRMEDLSREALTESLASLRRLLELIDAGKVECEPEQRERLRGAEGALLVLVSPRGK